jgi:hypothetical protein
MVAILTAVILTQHPELDGDAGVLQAIALVRGGMGERELVEAIEAVIIRGWESPGEGWLRPAAEEILVNVDFVMAMRAALDSQ